MRTLLAIVAIVAVAAFALAINAVLVDVQTRKAVARDGGFLLDTGVVRANVRVDGGGGTPVVLIHGFGAALDWWDRIVPELAKRHRVICVDLIGHGGTEAPSSGYSIERQAALVKAVMDKLNAGRAIVIGHSMGGEVATALAALNSDRVERLVLIATPPKADARFDFVTRLALAPIIGQFLWRLRTDEVLSQALVQGFAPGFSIPADFVDDLRQLTYTAFSKAHRESVAYVTGTPTYKRLGALDPRPPVLVIFGSRDALVAPSSAKFYESVEGAKVEMIDGVGHSAMVEAPEKTLALIKAFIGE